MDLDVSFAGKVSDLPRVNENLYKVQASGSVRLTDVAFTRKRNRWSSGISTAPSISTTTKWTWSRSAAGSLPAISDERNVRQFHHVSLIPNQPGYMRARLESSRLN